ncbi:cytochrome d ubiquinol oxidase subunit II [Phycicoccus endophyticus]|uniref:Cytochrome d ubiquinol oxidase subunit II n=1 Tax=Phycicoccus endophyticus TaxID=1690220 RepID=A0A7G9R1D2_9MICO|nr:cytochrome d ubiquinol oxidase subunit II [Phycicoccus endophyticus]NHI18811.1 cytochrome d ubiquinol oxidase subunit II [Phycicoccus endophyticus]QNN49407.1 cytochrome d ubiquinol oxidase subunit II [Phycicoccus endophyticus]GGL36378.1 cytochrome c oxidase assembly protein [Phycicoccus endophyticus]
MDTLQLVWFGLIGLLWAGYLVLEGFDFGVGALLPALGAGRDAVETEKRRRVMLTTIGPHWDGNEVWLLTAGGATFAAFPEWYATMFSAFYLPLLLVLVALIVRNMGFEYRGKRDDDTWRARWDWAIIGGSVVAPFLVGVALTNVVHGVPLDGDSEYTGNLFTLLNPLSLLGGLTVLALSLTHGAFFLALKTTGTIREDARRMGTTLGLVAAGLAVVTLLWLGVSTGSVWSWVTTVIAAGALLGAIFANTKRREGWAFVGTAVTAAMAVATYFLALYPDVMPSSLTGGRSLTIENASSSPLTLKIMTGAALVFTPIVLLYTAYTYYTFRKRIGTQHIPAAVAVK